MWIRELENKSNQREELDVSSSGFCISIFVGIFPGQSQLIFKIPKIEVTIVRDAKSFENTLFIPNHYLSFTIHIRN